MRAQNKSEWAALAAGVCAPVILWCAGAGWLWVLIGGGAAAALWPAFCVKMDDRPLPRRICDVLGDGAGRCLLLAQAASLAAVAAVALRRAGQIIPNLDSAYPWTPLVLIVLAYAAAKGKNDCVNRCATVLFWLPALSAALILLFALPQVQTQWMPPQGSWTQSLAAGAIFLWPVLSLVYTPSARQVKWLPAAFALFGTLCAFVCDSCLSPRVAASEKVAFFTMAASERLLGLASRFDALLSAAAIAALFCFLAKLLSAVPTLTGSAQQTGKQIAFCMIAFAASAVRSVVLDLIAVGSALVFWALAPLIVLYLPREKR